MLKTIKSRIIFFTIVILSILSITTFYLFKTSYRNVRTLKIEALDTKIDFYAETINKRIGQYEENVTDLSIMGDIFYFSSSRSHSTLDKLVLENFKKDRVSIGGGIFFEPYVVNKKEKFFSTYVFDGENGLQFDEDYRKGRVNYLEKTWYKELKAEFENGKNVAWSTPYIDNVGTKSLMITSGAPIRNYKGEVLGVVTSDWKLDEISTLINDLKPTKDSFVIFSDFKNGFIITIDKDNVDPAQYIGKKLNDLSWYDDTLENFDEIKYKDRPHIFFKEILENNTILIICVPKHTFLKPVKHRFLTIFYVLVTSFALLTLFIYLVLIHNVNKPIEYMMKKAQEIGSGNIDEKMDIAEPKEFAELASSFNKMTEDIKNYLANIEQSALQRKQIDSELKIAKDIQSSALPRVFPAYPDRPEFDIFAIMEPAKEVGGDFYDFFFLDKENILFLVADVSGKGIPAALFMMRAKAFVNTIAHLGYSLSETIEKVNKEICLNNKYGFFITMFCAVLNTKTGVITYVNAGHNPPIIKNQNEAYYLKTNHNIVLGVFDDATFEEGTKKLKDGDSIVLYTDGVTDALNLDDEFYGENNLLKCVEYASSEDGAEEIVDCIKGNVEVFTRQKEKEDDVTILTLKYNMKDDYLKLNLHNGISEFNELIEKIEEKLESKNIKRDIITRVNIVVEEFYTNIIKYAYNGENGEIEVALKVELEKISVIFKDSGAMFNPIKREDEDINKSIDERQLGGLGILLSKNLSDNIIYKRENGQNILIVEFKIV